MEQDRHASRAEFVEEAIQPVRMVGMAVAQHNGLNGAEIDAEHRQVVQRSVRRHPGIKQDRLPLPLVDQGYQEGKRRARHAIDCE